MARVTELNADCRRRGRRQQSLSGGKGSALGALFGALVIQLISTGIVILGINQNYSQIIIGAVVIVAVVLDQLNNWLAKLASALRLKDSYWRMLRPFLSMTVHYRVRLIEVKWESH